jgi:DNA mismatch endonuclease (patch repair protein)
MPDKFAPEVRSRIMSAIRSKNTGIERQVFSHLRRQKIHFQRHYRAAFGSPDVAVPSRRLAVFIDGDFWHGYRYPLWRHKLPSAFWTEKIERNRARDARNFAKLRRRGWRVMRVWEHELTANPDRTLSRIADFLRVTPVVSSKR